MNQQVEIIFIDEIRDANDRVTQRSLPISIVNRNRLAIRIIIVIRRITRRVNGRVTERTV